MRRGYTRADRVFQALGVAQAILGLAFVVFAGDVGFGVLLVTVGMLIGVRPWTERVNYNAGWMAGRVAFVLSMGEAQARGMHPIEWLLAEAERDGHEITLTALPREEH